MIDLFLICSIFILLSLSAYFSGAEAALFSLPITKIATYQQSKSSTKQLIAALLKRPRDLLVTIFMLNTMVNILLQSTVSSYFGEYAGWLLKVGVPLVLTLLFGEILPKYLGLQHNIAISEWVAKSIYYINEKIKPIREATTAITVPVSRLLFFYLKKEPEISKDELTHILKKSREQGIFSDEEGDFLAGYLRLQDLTIREAMRPSEDVLFYNIHDPLPKLVHLFVDKECAKIPICDGDLDHVLGILSAEKLLLHRDSITTSQDLLKIVSKPLFVPEGMDARLLLRRFQKGIDGFALVVDEYGTVTGLVTLEDIIEIVIGEITDLRDTAHLYTKAGENVIITSGKLELSEFNQLFQSDLQSPNNMITIGGWLMEKLGEVPLIGTKVELDGFIFQILAATPNRIHRIYIRKVK